MTEAEIRRELDHMLDDMYMHENDRDYYDECLHKLLHGQENEEGLSEEELESLIEQEDQAARENHPYIEECLDKLSDLRGYKVTMEDYIDDHYERNRRA